MDVRVILSTFIIFLGFFTTFIECAVCFNSPSSNDVRSDCPRSKPSCCGTTRNGRSNVCAASCLNHKCDTNNDCGGLVCCSGSCSDKRNCLPVTTWGVVGIAIVSLFFVLAMFRACQWCRKRRVRMQQNVRSTNVEQRNQPPFVVSDFENHGFVAPMAPPSYDSVVRNDRSENYEHPPIYNLNLQTIINNSTTSDTGSSNLVHQVNISIRGSAMFNADFPPSYSEVASSSDDNVGLPPSYSSSQGTAESFEERTLSFNDEPPPYTLDQELSNNSTREEEHSALGVDSAASVERQTVSNTVTQDDNVNEQSSYEISSDHQVITPNSFESASAISEDGQPRQCQYVNIAEDSAPSERNTDSELITTRL